MDKRRGHPELHLRPDHRHKRLRIRSRQNLAVPDSEQQIQQINSILTDSVCINDRYREIISVSKIWSDNSKETIH